MDGQMLKEEENHQHLNQNDTQTIPSRPKFTDFPSPLPPRLLFPTDSSSTPSSPSPFSSSLPPDSEVASLAHHHAEAIMELEQLKQHYLSKQQELEEWKELQESKWKQYENELLNTVKEQEKRLELEWKEVKNKQEKERICERE